MPESVAVNTFSIVISTFGSDYWRDLALSRAHPSSLNQAADEIIIHHSPTGTLAQCRNEAIAKAKCDFVICCDADDQLEPGYCEAMRQGTGDIRVPAVRYVYPENLANGVLLAAQVLPKRPFSQGNYIVIGAAFRRDLFLKVGGFEELPAWEDWALWMRMYIEGATIHLCKKAVYRAFRSVNGRNIVSNPRELMDRILGDLRPKAELKGIAL